MAANEEVAKAAAEAGVAGEQVVTPWEVEAGDDGGIDYEKLMRDFGSSAIDDALLDRMERVTGKPVHPWLRRGIFYSHRDLGKILDLYEAGKPFYLYTGRGPSSDALHLGHTVPMMLCRWLADTFNVPTVIQLTTDEKHLWKPLELHETERLAFENARDIIALGFDITRTFIFTNLQYMSALYPTVVRVQKAITYSQARGAFGFEPSNSVGQVAFCAIQAAPSFSAAFPQLFGGDEQVPCLIPQAIDQDPYFRVTRDVAPRLGWLKPALVHSTFFPALQGAKSKMSGSSFNSAVFVTDTPKQIADKINKYALSGGRETVEEHREKGGDTSIDVSYQWLTFFLDDDKELARIKEEYESGRMLTGELKKILIDTITPIVQRHQRARAAVTDDVVRAFMRVRKLDL